MQLVCSLNVSKLKLPSPRASLVFSWRQVAAFPRLGPGGSVPSTGLWYRSYPYGFSAQGHYIGEGWQGAKHTGVQRQEGSRKRSSQSIGLKLRARSLAPRCVTTSGQQDALAIVSISRSCTTVKATAPSV